MWLHEVPRWQKDHGYKWKYQKYESKHDELTYIGDIPIPIPLEVRKPFTGLTDPYRAFIFSVIFTKVCVAVVLAVFGAAWIMSENNAGDLILNTLASCFIFEVDEIVYQGFTMELGKTICDPDRHKIQYCRRENRMRLTSPVRLLSFWIRIGLFILGVWTANYLWCHTAQLKQT